MRMVLLRGARLLLAGTALGLLGSIAVGRYLARRSLERPPSILLRSPSYRWYLFAGLPACVWPALRAARINPIVALKQD